MLQDFYNKLSDQEKKIFYATLGAIALAVSDALFMQPANQKLKTLDTEITQTKSDIKRDARLMSYQDKILHENEIYGIYKTDEKKTDDQIMAEFLKTIESLEKDTEVTLGKVNPAESVPKKGYVQYFANIECSGKFENIIKFIHKIDTTPNLLKVVKMNIAGKKSSADEINVSMKVSKIIIDAASKAGVLSPEEAEILHLDMPSENQGDSAGNSSGLQKGHAAGQNSASRGKSSGRHEGAENPEGDEKGNSQTGSDGNSGERAGSGGENSGGDGAGGEGPGGGSGGGGQAGGKENGAGASGGGGGASGGGGGASGGGGGASGGGGGAGGGGGGAGGEGPGGGSGGGGQAGGKENGAGTNGGGGGAGGGATGSGTQGDLNGQTGGDLQQSAKTGGKNAEGYQVGKNFEQKDAKNPDKKQSVQTNPNIQNQKSKNQKNSEIQSALDDIDTGQRAQVSSLESLWNNFWGIKPKKSQNEKKYDPHKEHPEDYKSADEVKPNLWERMLDKK